VLDDPAVVVEAEDVDPGVVLVAGSVLEAVQHDEVSLGDGALELDALSRVLGRHALEVVDERLLPVADVRVVLGVMTADVARRASAGRLW